MVARDRVLAAADALAGLPEAAVGVPQLAYGKSDSFVVYLNFARMAATGRVDDAYQVAAVQSAWRLFAPLGLVHLTTVWPGRPRVMTPGGRPRALRPGEYVEVEAVEDTSSVPTSGSGEVPGGYTWNQFDRNPDLCLPVRSIVRVTDANPILWGVRAVHEWGHAFFNSVRGENGHTDNPLNFMYGGPGPLNQGATMDAVQVSRVGPQIDLVRGKGLRWSNVTQAWVKVIDQGKPPWVLSD